MPNYSIKLDLLKLKGASVIELKGRTATKKCVVIPIEDSNLYLGEKGVYLDIRATELQNPQYDDTYCLKQKLSKEAYNLLTEDEQKQIPIIGGMRPIERKRNTMNVTSSVDASSNSDIPF